MHAVGSGDVDNSRDLEGIESGRASPEPGQPANSRASLLGPVQTPSALTGQQLGEVLDSLRELGSVHMNLGLLQRSGALAFADGLKHCPVSTVHTAVLAMYKLLSHYSSSCVHTWLGTNPHVSMYIMCSDHVQRSLIDSHCVSMKAVV